MSRRSIAFGIMFLAAVCPVFAAQDRGGGGTAAPPFERRASRLGHRQFSLCVRAAAQPGQ